MPRRRYITTFFKRILAVIVLPSVIRLPAQDRLNPESLNDPLIHSPDIFVNFTNGVDPPIPRKGSVQRLANSWNHLVDQFRTNESRFSSIENDALDAILQHIQGGLGWIGLRPVEKNTVPNSWQDFEQLTQNTSALCKFLRRKHDEYPKIQEFENLWMTARMLDEDVVKLAPAASASQQPR